MGTRSTIGDDGSSQYPSDAFHYWRRRELPVPLRCAPLLATTGAPSTPQMRSTIGDDGSSQYASDAPQNKPQSKLQNKLQSRLQNKLQSKLQNEFQSKLQNKLR